MRPRAILPALFVLAMAVPALAQGARDGSLAGTRKEAVQSRLQSGLGTHKDEIAGAVAGNTGDGQVIAGAETAFATLFPDQDPQAYVNCVVSNATRQQLAVLAGAASSGAYEEAAAVVADILKNPETQTCFHQAGLPQLP